MGRKPWHDIIRKAFEFPPGDWPFALEREMDELQSRLGPETDLYGEEVLRLQRLLKEHGRRQNCLLKITSGLPDAEDVLVRLKALEQHRSRRNGC